MPWNTQKVMTLRLDFVRLALQKEIPFSELCKRFEVSRTTGYKWLERYEKQGAQGLADQSRRPLNSPTQTCARREAPVLELRREHPAWGARKLQRRLQDLKVKDVPASSTITSILHRHDLINAQASENASPWQRFEHEQPNHLWQIDFKGNFATISEGQCYPLTLLDDHSRYNLLLQACRTTTAETVQTHLTRVFEQYGLPARINADNGSPWGSPARPGQLTGLAIWLIRLGVQLSHSRAYHPQTNGKDERFHRSLKAEVLATRVFKTQGHVQEHLDRWRPVYNYERPHEGIGMQTPGSRYRPSARKFPDQLAPVEYPSGDTVMRVRWNGELTYNGIKLKVSSALHNMDVGARPNPQHAHLIDLYFSDHRLMTLDLKHPSQPL